MPTNSDNARTLALRNNGNATRSSDASRTRARAPSVARWQRKFLNALRKAPNVAYACRVARISRQVAYSHKNNDETFAAKWEEALSASVDRCEEKAFDMAWKGDSQLLQFILRAHRREKYGDVSRMEIDARHCGVILMPELEKKDP